MRFYTVHLKGGRLDGHAELVPDGFCWPALLLGPLWPAVRGLWREAALVAGAWGAVGLLALALPQAGGWAALLLWLLGGFEGHWLARRALRRRGYREAAVIAGHGRDEAELKLAAAMLQAREA